MIVGTCPITKMFWSTKLFFCFSMKTINSHLFRETGTSTSVNLSQANKFGFNTSHLLFNHKRLFFSWQIPFTYLVEYQTYLVAIVGRIHTGVLGPSWLLSSRRPCLVCRWLVYSFVRHTQVQRGQSNNVDLVDLVEYVCVWVAK